ncbi:4Fe-4S binding protein [Halosquirtibacter xylanolyticus]|uniref:4Fe-4S binding protein n=1 Tax=Halosquirtibacter xylanolyticus TaxID=3374599 RepID=UPI00374A6969|nr:4Fe-4S binding protein [Prolixibacteraceae bacterium]
MGLKNKLFAKELDKELRIKNGILTIDQNSCDGCGVCVQKCPFDAMTIIELSREQIEQLSFKGRLKVRIKGANKAFVDDHLCTVCGACMKTCHEFAIHKVVQD